MCCVPSCALPAPAPVPCQAKATCCMVMRPRGQVQHRPSPSSPQSRLLKTSVRPFTLPGHRASQGRSQPKGRALDLLTRRSLAVALRVPPAVTAGTQGEIRGGCLEAGTPAQQAWRAWWAGRPQRGTETPNSPPKGIQPQPRDRCHLSRQPP